MQKRLVTAADIRKALRSGQKSLHVPSEECIVTPMARDEAEDLGILLDEEPKTASAPCEKPTCPPTKKSEELVKSEELAKTQELVKTVSSLIQKKGASSVSAKQLENVVRQVVSSKLGLAVNKKSPDKAPPAIAEDQGVRFINAERLLQESDGLSSVPEKMLVAGAIGDKNGEKLAGGYLVWEKATFDRRVEAPEIAIVIEGELHLAIDGETIVGRPGDMIYLPEGAVVAYHAPGKVKLACVNFN